MTGVEIVTLRPDEVASAAERLLTVYRSAFSAPPYHEGEPQFHRFAEQMLPVHVRRPGFRCLAAREPGAHELAGFAYGYTSAAGQWWHDNVLVALAPDVVAEWDAGAFEVAEVAVAGPSQARGLGGRLHDRLLADLPHRRAVLSARRDAAAAMRLYLSRGWTVLGEVPGSSVSVVMGLTLGSRESGPIRREPP